MPQLCNHFQANFSVPSKQGQSTSASLLGSQRGNQEPSSVPLGQHIAQGLVPWSHVQQIASSSHESDHANKLSVTSGTGSTTRLENLGSYINQGIQPSSPSPTESPSTVYNPSEMKSFSNVSTPRAKASASSSQAVSAVTSGMTHGHDVNLQGSSLVKSTSSVLPVKASELLLTGKNNSYYTSLERTSTVHAMETLTMSSDTNSARNGTYLENAL
ncbi:hypothetical protein EV356DRAFT_513561 [Viridothelium virens]|uniref:Uncharacterized protein n=1 Tax=Viridothelium virens TaxID=1048519 RepID=A0A6A6HER5_VIRVR|nr:hypothetical protein EV356DRAFT_513561 [Viridothelium virens]